MVRDLKYFAIFTILSLRATTKILIEKPERINLRKIIEMICRSIIYIHRVVVDHMF